ncbi:VOC family protein [Micromonospora tulbaghiae]|uniref:Uncharacterized conserved protein PhnB, glyoxalase superfamily n=1 Tax=Micromonospora tulbaghiae TaxID=479978 RepID=A0ABY0KHG8_9ACTN|nr:VOC family protein [Micromonospora tulbaghiae]MDX5459244.1 VOC family protein [Micromonospora tulbaghiae]SCE73558.1 Uncharacterized conserved protein PhnB, glyoxalase superfamily [Micromonospora tulbaghiae]
MAAIPYLKYENVGTALDWLAKSFGFTEQQRYAGPDGAVFHAEMTTPSGDLVYLAGPGEGYRSPRRLGEVTVMISLEVDDVDAQHALATAAGATVQMPPTDTPQGMRVCKVEDLEGHEWFFTKKITD